MARAIHVHISVVSFHSTRISSVAFSPCGGYVASGGASDEHVYVWSLDKPSGTPLKIENAHKEGCTRRVDRRRGDRYGRERWVRGGVGCEGGAVGMVLLHSHASRQHGADIFPPFGRRARALPGLSLSLHLHLC